MTEKKDRQTTRQRELEHLLLRWRLSGEKVRPTDKPTRRTDKQTEIQTDRQTDRQTNRQTRRRTEKWIDRDNNRKTLETEKLEMLASALAASQ